MNIESGLSKDFSQEQTKVKAEKTESKQEPYNNIEQKEVNPYLNFSNDEKAKIISSLSTSEQDVGGKQLEFPTESEKIESLIFSFPQHCETKRLVEVVLNNKEYAPKLTREVVRRKEYSKLEGILNRYKGTPTFEYCVCEIESGLSEDELRDNVLMALSETMTKTSDKEKREPSAIAEHEADMKKEKTTGRLLIRYQELFKMSETELEALSGKELLLIGGGSSPIKAELKAKGIDCVVTNIDPIAKADEENADHVIKDDFFNTKLDEDKYREIWALHSLPTYAFTPEQVNDFYSHSISSLKKGGVLRVAPVNKFSDSFTPAMRLSRKPVNNASTRFIEELKTRPDLFSVAEFTVEHKGKLGIKTEMPSVKIEVIGDKEQIKEFLK